MRSKVLTLILLIIICIMLFFSQNVYAVVDTNGISINPDNQFDDFGSKIISTIRIIGMIVSVAALMIIGIRYMISSVEEKAMQKESMIFYCIGAVLVFAIVNIVSAVYDWIITL